MKVTTGLRDIPGLRAGWGPLVLVMVLLAVLPLIGLPKDWTLNLFLFFTFLTIANMWNLLAGYSGLISLCQPAFMGVAGYIVVLFTWNGLPFYWGIIGGGLVAAALALAIAFPVFRLRGMYFAIGTLIIPEMMRNIFYLWQWFEDIQPLSGGGAGYIIKGITEVTTTHCYWFALAIAVASILTMRFTLNSRVGLGLAAIRDNDNTAASCGINVFRLKLIPFVIGAFITGLAGAVFWTKTGNILPIDAFKITWTMQLLLATVIGGIGTKEGPIVGASIITIFYLLLGRFGAMSLLAQGIILVVIMLLAPRGIMGSLRYIRAYRSLITTDHVFWIALVIGIALIGLIPLIQF